MASQLQELPAPQRRLGPVTLGSGDPSAGAEVMLGMPFVLNLHLPKKSE